MTDKLGHVEVGELEEAVMDITRRLKEGVQVDSSVSRDLLGTLHVNLCALVREAEKTAKMLEWRHGFRR
jgi:hypothetical protein